MNNANAKNMLDILANRDDLAICNCSFSSSFVAAADSPIRSILRVASNVKWSGFASEIRTLEINGENSATRLPAIIGRFWFVVSTVTAP